MFPLVFSVLCTYIHKNFDFFFNFMDFSELF